MALILGHQLPHVQSQKHLTGCLAHVINIFAQVAVFGNCFPVISSPLPTTPANIIAVPEVEDTRGVLLNIDKTTKMVRNLPGCL